MDDSQIVQFMLGATVQVLNDVFSRLVIAPFWQCWGTAGLHVCLNLKNKDYGFFLRLASLTKKTLLFTGF